MTRRFCLSLALLSGFVASQATAQSCDTAVELVNGSGVQIDELYYNPSSMSSWGRDRLGENVLAGGRKTTFRPGRGGAHDFRVVWSGGKEAEIRGVDVCAISRITATNGRLAAE